MIKGKFSWYAVTNLKHDIKELKNISHKNKVNARRYRLNHKWQTYEVTLINNVG